MLSRELLFQFNGTVPYTGLDFFFLPFDVPEGIAEIQIDHMQTDADSTNVSTSFGMIIYRFVI
jgi:hypothetical protein